jgi:threonine dehydrogenase-like Zn-dependent dehydrogenase
MTSGARGWQLTASGQLQEIRFHLPPLEPGWARVRFAYCGVCGSDIASFSRRPVEKPISLGHEFVAIIEAVGNGVQELAPGDIVVSDLNFRCGRCEACLHGRTHLCTGGQIGRFSNRGFATRANMDVSYLVLANRGAPKPQFVLCEPLSCVLHALDWALKDKAGSVLVLGVGGLGLCAALSLPSLSNRHTFHFWDPKPTRLNMLPLGPQVRKLVEAPRGRDYEVVIDLSGSPAGLFLACASVKRGGRLCSMSHLDGFAGLGSLFDRLMRIDAEFKVSYLNGAKSNVARAVDIVTEHWSTDFDRCLGVHSIETLPELLRCRESSPHNKDLVDISSWHD